MLQLRDLVIPLLAATIVGILVWAYLDRRLRNGVALSNAGLSGHYIEHRHPKKTPFAGSGGV
jgi:hypothetical protein